MSRFEKTAYEMTKMMQNVVNSGTGRKARIDWPVAGKTDFGSYPFYQLQASRYVLYDLYRY
jgi:hypothetical protein